MEIVAEIKQDTSDEDSLRRDNIKTGVNLEFQRHRTGYANFFISCRSTWKANVKKFVEENRKMLEEAKAQHCNHIMFKPETGWACHGYRRCHEHKTLTSSPDVFRLAQLLLSYLFPDKGFKLHQYMVFDVLDVDHADIGESIGSQIGASYSTYGGFNAAQAGISVTSAKKMTGGDWITVRRNAIQKNYMRYFKGNIQAMNRFYTAEHGKQKVCSSSRHF